MSNLFVFRCMNPSSLQISLAKNVIKDFNTFQVVARRFEGTVRNKNLPFFCLGNVNISPRVAQEILADFRFHHWPYNLFLEIDL